MDGPQGFVRWCVTVVSLRTLFFLFISGLTHYLAARWLLGTFSPAVRAKRKRLVFGIAGGLATLLGTARFLANFFESTSMRTVIAVAMLELGAIAIGLLPLGIMWLAIHLGSMLSWMLRRKTRTTPEASEADDAPEVAAPDPALVSRRQAIERVVGVSLFASTTAALGWGTVRGRHAFAIEEVVVRVKGWPPALEGYTIAQVSDVHVGTFVRDRELDEGFELVKRIKPDLVVATGDLVDFESEAVELLALRLLASGARDGAYAIVGNHDHYAGPADVVRRLRAAGVTALCNQSLRIREGDGGGFALVGLDDMQGRFRPSSGFSGPDLIAATQGLAPDLPQILLAHQPRYFREAAGRVALQLSGHTHGGQINPGFRPADLLMEYVAGRYERNGSTLWVNRGFGVAGPPSRVGAPPEVTKIVLVSG